MASPWCSGACSWRPLIYDLLAREGYRLGKFLLMGPLLGGVYIAATPVTAIWGITPSESLTKLVLNCFLGIVIGDGVGLGAEAAELIRRAIKRLKAL